MWVEDREALKGTDQREPSHSRDKVSAKICEVRRSSCRFPPRSLPFIRAAREELEGIACFFHAILFTFLRSRGAFCITFIRAACLNYAGLDCKQRNTKFKNTCSSSGVDEESSPHGWCMWLSSGALQAFTGGFQTIILGVIGQAIRIFLFSLSTLSKLSAVFERRLSSAPFVSCKSAISDFFARNGPTRKGRKSTIIDRSPYLDRQQDAIEKG